MNTIFDNLLSLKEAADMWHLEESTIRKAIASNKFRINVDVKKFGKQWVIDKKAMENVYGVLESNSFFEEPNKSKAEDIYYFIFECMNAYSNKYKESSKKANQDFLRCNIYEYIYECYDYLHLLSINENIKDFRNRIRKGYIYA